jgi:hypothetical protein
MLRVNLTQELQAIREASVGEATFFAYDEYATALLENLGIDTYLTQQLRLKKRQQLMQSAYTEAQVQKLCIKYRLRCLEAELFKGEIDQEVPEKKLEFERDFTQAMQQEVDKDGYRIIAPSEMFHLTKIELDPLLLYRFQENGTTYYKLIHQWGGDMSRWRSIVNYPLRSLKHLIVCSLLLWSVILLPLSLSISGLSTSEASLLIGLVVIAPTIFTVSCFKNLNGEYQTSDRLWNSNEE